MTERIRCSRCKRVKGPRSFTRDAGRENGWYPWCKPCVTEYRQDHHFQSEEDKDLGRNCPVCDKPLRGSQNRDYCSVTCKGKARGWRSKYNLTPAEFRSLIPEDKRCPICRKRPTLWNVDHNHRTGQIMGLVCTQCNVGALAATYHDIELVQRLMDFLTNPPAAHLEKTANPERIGPSRLREVWTAGGKYTPQREPDDDLPF